MQAHLVQLDIQWEDREANFAAVAALLDGAQVATADLVLLPEMFDSGFSLNIETTADTDNRTQHFLSDQARQRRCFIHAGLTVLAPHNSPKPALNRAITFDPTGAPISTYDKLHPFTYGREGERFARGTHIETYDLPLQRGTGVPPVSPSSPRTTGVPPVSLTICPTICYDLRFPELFRAGLAKGASIFTVVANWPAGRREHWRALLIARAIENQAIVLGVNRCGKDPHLNYLGGSIAVDAQGHVLAEADDRQQVLTVPLDLDRLTRWRTEFPAWRDQHPALWPPKNTTEPRP